MLLWNIQITLLQALNIFTVVAPQAIECHHCLKGMTVGLLMM
jgi:hypothetical protein